MTTLYEEMHGYPIEKYDRLGFSATRKVICDWSIRHTVVVLLAYSPSVYPYNAATPQWGSAIVQNVTVEPFPGKETNAGVGQTDIAVYEKAIVTVEYATPGFSGESKQIESGVLVSEKFDTFTEFLTLDPSKFTWKSDGKQLSDAEAPGRQIHGLTWAYTRHDAPLPLDTDVTDFIGMVNDAAVTSLSAGSAAFNGLLFPAETLLYIKPEITLKGAEKATVTLHFQYNPQGWNRFWRTTAGTAGAYDEIQLGGVDYKNYPLAPFANLTL